MGTKAQRTAATGHRDPGSPEGLVDPSELRGTKFTPPSRTDFGGFPSRDEQCRLLDSGEPLSGLWIGRYPGSGNEHKRVLGVTH